MKTVADYQKFAMIMATLAEVFDDGKAVSKIKAEIYFKALESHTIEHISKAVTRLIKTRVFPSFPKPAELLQEIEGRNENRATDAWIKVINAVRRIGNYESVRFSDPVIHSVIQSLGGWPQLCMMEIKAETWKQREFEKLYAVISERPGKHPEYLPGTCEIDNAARGYDLTPNIRMIGFGKTALKMVAVK